jgi:hypothetical protein
MPIRRNTSSAGLKAASHQAPRLKIEITRGAFARLL